MAKTVTYLTQIVPHLEERYGEEQARAIMQAALPRYDELLAENAGEPKAYHMHTHERIYPAIAVFDAMTGQGSRAAMQRVLDETGVELLSLSRPLLFDPAFSAKLKAGECEASGCISCNACYSTPEHRCRFRRSERWHIGSRSPRSAGSCLTVSFSTRRVNRSLRTRWSSPSPASTGTSTPTPST